MKLLVNDPLRDALHDVAASAAVTLPSARERQAASRRGWAAGRDAALDVTVVNPLQAGTIVGASVTPGHALEYRYNAKMSESLEACDRQGIAFLPIVLESLGGFHPVATREVKKLASALARHTGEEEGETTRKLFVRLSILVMKGNSAILSNRIPSLQDTYTEIGEI